MFPKILQIIIHIDNDILYGSIHFPPEIVCIPAYMKMTKFDKICNFWILHCSRLRFSICLFSHIPHYTTFCAKILHPVEITIFDIHAFFHIFVKLKYIVLNTYIYDAGNTCPSYIGRTFPSFSDSLIIEIEYQVIQNNSKKLTTWN